MEPEVAKILFVEDDEDLATRIQQWLKFEGHMVEHSGNGLDAHEKLECFKFDIVVLDIGLPGLSGLEVLKRFRAGGSPTPVLLLTGKGEVKEKEEGLDAGADDYLTKPFDVRELSARLRALLRRPSQFVGTSLSAGGITIDTAEHRVAFGETEIELQPKEFSILEFLVRHAGKVVATESLLEYVWSSDSHVTSETLYTHLKKIRKKLAAAGANDIIKTVHGVGYKVEK